MSHEHTDAELLALARALADLDHPVKAEVNDWASEHLAQRDRIDADRNTSFARDDWQRCADRGILRVFVPEEQGGKGGDLATTLLTLEGLGQGCRDNGFVYGLCSQVLTTQETLAKFGTAEQHARYLEPMMSGQKIGAFSMTEPDTGSDAYQLSTSAEKRDDGTYVLNGHKAYVTFGTVCDFVIVFASTNPAAGSWGLSAFIVPTDLDGVEQLPNRDKMGMRTTPFGDITLTDVVVPADALVGREGAGASIFNAVVQVERAFVFITQVGSMQRQLEGAVRYANERVQGGRPIGNYQAVSHRLAEMKQEHETARLFIYKAAIALTSGKDATMAAALAKIVGADTGIALAMGATAIHGAKGYVSDFEVERDLRDAIGGIVYSGTTDIQRNIISRLMGVG